ncbi:MAG: TonB-dependent receptor plug domain-containing protein [Methyloglobulus sp.]|nr:TonB-dependent receptor plug domain-containing protein [Methyloglobulus sp.]
MKKNTDDPNKQLVMLRKIITFPILTALMLIIATQTANATENLADTETADATNPVDPSSGGATLEKVTVEADASDPYDDPNWANDPYNKAYTIRNSSTATKTDTPIFDTPVSVQVVPRSVMDDQKATRITDVLENVSGVRAQPSLGIGNNFIIRGFQNNNVYRNGLRSNNIFPQEFDTANLQNVEVLKGPAQLYGRTEPGGLVSLTTKKPLDTPYYSLEQRFGSYDFYREGVHGSVTRVERCTTTPA